MHASTSAVNIHVNCPFALADDQALLHVFKAQKYVLHIHPTQSIDRYLCILSICHAYIWQTHEIPGHTFGLNANAKRFHPFGRLLGYTETILHSTNITSVIKECTLPYTIRRYYSNYNDASHIIFKAHSAHSTFHLQSKWFTLQNTCVMLLSFFSPSLSLFLSVSHFAVVFRAYCANLNRVITIQNHSRLRHYFTNDTRRQWRRTMRRSRLYLCPFYRVRVCPIPQFCHQKLHHHLQHQTTSRLPHTMMYVSLELFARFFVISLCDILILSRLCVHKIEF